VNAVITNRPRVMHWTPMHWMHIIHTRTYRLCDGGSTAVES